MVCAQSWSRRNPPLPSYGAVVSLRGDVESVDMFNNVLSYAGGGVDLVDGTHFTGVDRTNTTADPSLFNFAGNAVSVPYTSNWHLASLAQCFSASEFGMTVTEPQMNSTAGHECHGGARSGWVVRNNIAFNGSRPHGRSCSSQLCRGRVSRSGIEVRHLLQWGGHRIAAACKRGASRHPKPYADRLKKLRRLGRGWSVTSRSLAD